jgi:hypothetical protein
MEWPLLGGPVSNQLPHGGMTTCPTRLATFLTEQALPFLVQNWTVCLFAETGTWIGFVAISLDPTIPGTKLDLLVSSLKLELEFGLLQSLLTLPFLVQNWTCLSLCWNWNLNWVCCNLSRPDYSWYKTGLACLLLKLELELGLLQFSLGCALTMSSFR